MNNNYIGGDSDEEKKDEIEIAKPKYLNKWVRLTDKNNKVMCIGRKQEGVCAVIGGSKKHLLFVVYASNDIDIFNLHTMKYIKRTKLFKINLHRLPCFMLRNDKKGPAMAKANKKKTEMLLFCESSAVAIDYDESSNTLQFFAIRVCPHLGFCHGYVYVDDVIFFFGLNSVHKYSVPENKWLKCDQGISIPWNGGTAIFDEETAYVHIIHTEAIKAATPHIRAKLSEWMKKDTENERQWFLRDTKMIEEQKIEKDRRRIENNEQKFKMNLSKVELFEHAHKHLGWIEDFHFIIAKYIMVSLHLHFFFLYVMQLIIHIAQTKQNKTKRWNILKQQSAKFSADGTKLISTSDDNTVRIWDIASKKEIQVLGGHSASVIDAQFSPDGNMVVSCAKDDTIRLWDVKTGSELMKLKDHSKPITSVQFSPEGNTVVSSSYDNTIRIWNVQSGKSIKMEGHLAPVFSVQFSPDGQLLVSSSADRTIIIWKVKSGEMIHTLRGHVDIVQNVAFSFDGRSIISCSKDKTIRIWDAITGFEISKIDQEFAYAENAKLSPDNQVIVLFSSNSMKLWDVKLGMIIQEFNERTCIDISLDGSIIVSACSNGTIALFEKIEWYS
ncbi:WD repeat-containing protein [Reticulomyxa filosa]|uniref:WD repeat-containing protein n=1 Tax=Reticulomyxa filosa TaxID=46433 RepID=X6P6V7_RETFI|nr:WD repeat-containing protein [Reticulomyxa filosa]|eukprot:ETO33848.1 WD repeat-containing protein [Reticulomyxa filosa]